jgi:acyl carrier protein
MENTEIQTKVIEMLSKQLKKNKDTIVLTQRLNEDLGADSLDTVELLMSLEEQFGITIPDDKAGELKTVGSVVDYIATVIK